MFTINAGQVDVPIRMDAPDDLSSSYGRSIGKWWLAVVLMS